MAMVNSKTVKRLMAEATKALGREPTLRELYRLLSGDTSVLSKKEKKDEKSA